MLVSSKRMARSVNLQLAQQMLTIAISNLAACRTASRAEKGVVRLCLTVASVRIVIAFSC